MLSFLGCLGIFVFRAWAVSDPRCPPPSCCDQKGGRCWQHGLWTFSYCCAKDGAEDCYRWGEDSPGEDIASTVVHSGVQCRHMCQSHESCAYWTFIVDAAEVDLTMRGRCFLKSARALQQLVKAHPFVVSGERLCHYFGEGMTTSEAQLRSGIQIERPWQTAIHRGGPGLLDGAGTPAWFLEASKSLDELGFVVLLDAFEQQQRSQLLDKIHEVSKKLLSLDPERLGNRGPRRYSFGGASRTLHMMHKRGWERLLDNEAVHLLLSTYYEDGFLACGGGGDFVLPNTSTYQSLHLDVGGPVHSLVKAPAIGVNFVLEDLTCADAPLRVVPFSHRDTSDPPDLMSESKVMKHSVLCPLPAGSAIVRDLRLWHGGTPSGSSSTRYLPNAEFVSLTWGSLTCGSGEILDPCQPVLPAAMYGTLSAFGQEISRRLISAELDDSNDDWLIPDFRGYHRHRQEAY
ncbi:unnamed protein product [Cladocopium goreaui]|uniref:Obg-like ATPase 1 n=1 Tax=Cladocopium goreaui TaxID=2562237 RepID=A0A9P1CTJ9_9DINO|nr:unnamed protein product [Cladocopium goreaui]